jgi:hypothetical protein
MTNAKDLDDLRPEFAGLTKHLAPFIAADAQAYMDCMYAFSEAERLDHPAPLLANWRAFGRLRLLSITLRDLYDQAKADIERNQAKAQATALEANPTHPEFAASMTAAHWDRNTAQHASRIVNAWIAEEEADS